MLKIYAIQALKKISDVAAIEPLLSALETTTSSSIRYTIIEALGSLGDASLIDIILQYKDDESHHVQQHVVHAVENLRSQRSE